MKHENPNKSIAVRKTEIYKGAIPPPDMMEGYKALDPSFPDRILSMAEKEQAHVHEMDKTTQRFAILQISVGLLAGLLTMGCLCWLIYFAITSNLPEVAIAIVTAMAAIIGVFVFRNRNSQK